MSKVAYNNCFGGFSLSYDGIMRWAELSGTKLYPFIDTRKDGRLGREMKAASPQEVREAFMVHYCTTPEYSNDSYWSDRDIDRIDPALIQTIEELGDKANGQCAKLAVEEIAAGTSYRIDEYDGNERVMTRDDYEWKTA